MLIVNLFSSTPVVASNVRKWVVRIRGSVGLQLGCATRRGGRQQAGDALSLGSLCSPPTKSRYACTEEAGKEQIPIKDQDGARS